MIVNQLFRSYFYGLYGRKIFDFCGFFSLLTEVNILAQEPNFGDDSSSWAENGECDDPRFQGSGMADTLVDGDRLGDATDCQTLFNLGEVRLR